MDAIADIGTWSAHVSPRTTWLFVRVRDVAGRSGWGEATLQDRDAVVQAHIERIAAMLVRDAATPSTDVVAAAGTAGATIEEAAAISALDQAFVDLRAQARGVSLGALLGPAPRPRVPLYANINRGTFDRSPDGFAARAVEAVDNGFDSVKIAPFDDVRPEDADAASGRQRLRLGIDRVAAVRSAIGATPRLMVDCHWRLTESSARDVLHAMTPLSLHWFECPLAEVPGNFDALRALRTLANARGVRMAGCETLTGVDAFRAFLDAGVYDVVMPDVKYVGGLDTMLRVGDAAAACGATCSPHNPSGPVAHVHSVHVASVLASFDMLEFQYAESPAFFDIVDGAMPDPRAGASAVPTVAGLGIGIDIAHRAVTRGASSPQRADT